MFIQQLFEGEIKRVIAIYPGRFQPFHLGHKEVFETLQAKFGMDNVFIGTSNKTDAVKSPFNFSDKLQLMTAAGVNNHHVIEVSSPYMPDDYIRAIGFNPAETVLIFAVGAPDQIASVLTGSQGSATQIFAGRIDTIFNAIAEVLYFAHDAHV